MRRFLFSTVLILNVGLAVSAIIAQTSEPPTWTTTLVKELVEQARTSTKQVTIDDLKEALDAKEDMLVLDVREADEYKADHIPGAFNLPRGLLEFEIWTVAPDRNKKIFVFCKTGVRAALATKRLNELGYKNAVSVNTGSVAWLLADYPVQTSITDEVVVIKPTKKD